MTKTASLHGHVVLAFSCVLVASCQASGGAASPPLGNFATPPNWAKYAYDALQSYKVIVDYWVGQVAENTEDKYFDVAGGWNDDVELAQSLAAYWLLTGDEPLAEMFKDMADKMQEAPYKRRKGIPWARPGDRRIEQGFTVSNWDVEHSSEEVTLLFPRLFYVDYGEPRVIELMVRCIWNFEDNMDGEFPGEKNWAQWVSSGMLMRSPRYNARNVDWYWPLTKTTIEPQDVVQNFRTTAPGLSVAWYYGTGHYFWREGPHGYMKNHHDAWMEACLRTDEGKPKYIPPSKILVPSLAFDDWTASQDSCGGDWKRAVWSFRHFYHAMVADWVMFRDSRDPGLASFADTASRIVHEAYKYRQTGKRILGRSLSVDRQFLQWRAESGPVAEDDTFLKTRMTAKADTRMMAYLIYLERGEPARAVSQAEQGFLDLKEYLKPKEREWTTRLAPTSSGLTDNVKFQSSDAFLMASVGGSGVYDAAYPTMYFSWNDTGAEVVSLVLKRNPTSTVFWAYNFGPTREVGIGLWRFCEGSGHLSVGPDYNADGEVDATPKAVRIPKVVKGGEVRFSLPSKSLQLVRIEVTNPRPRDLARFPDPAIGRRDYTHAGGTARVVVHNLGMKSTGRFKVCLLSANGRRVGPAQTIALPGFTGMTPVTRTLSWSVANPKDVAWVVLDPEDKVKEITELNNRLNVRKRATVHQ